MTKGSFPSPPLPKNRLRTYAHVQVLDVTRVDSCVHADSSNEKYGVNVQRTMGG